MSIFFNSGGNDDILSFFNLIQGYLRKLHQKMNLKICQFFSTLVGTMMFYLFFNLFQRILRMLHRNVNQMICQRFSILVGTIIFYLFLTSFKDICEKFHQMVNQMIYQLVSNPVGTMIVYLILSSFKDICESCTRKWTKWFVNFFQLRWERWYFIFFKPHSKLFTKFSSESKPNDFVNFFHLWWEQWYFIFFWHELHYQVNQMICQLFSTLVGTMIFCPFLTSFKDICESCFRK